jgi:hypothetical protein
MNGFRNSDPKSCPPPTNVWSADKVGIEQTIIGLQLYHGEQAVALARTRLRRLTDLFEPPHNRIQRVIFDLHNEGVVVSPTTVAFRLADDLGLRDIGGRDYLASISIAAPAAGSILDLRTQALRALGEWCELVKPIVISQLLHECQSVSSTELRAVAGVAAEFETARESKPVVATPFVWRDPSEISPRQWIFGRHALRKYVSVTGSDGGVGKTALGITESLSVVTGRPLLNDGRVEKGAAWYIGLEDDRSEYERRIAATILAHSVDPNSVRGGFFWDCGREQDFVIVRETRDGLTVAEPVIEGIKARIAQNNIALVTVDPFIASHAVSENDNCAIDFVMRQWTMIAEDTGCAVELIHHTRKGGGQGEQTADDLRGAGAIVRAARSVRVLVQMTEEESQRAGVDNRKRFFRVIAGAKANMALHTDSGSWRELVSIDLGNSGGIHPSDLVQAVMFWRFPDASDECSPEQLQAIKAAIKAGEWRRDMRAKNWVGHPVATVLGVDVYDQAGKGAVKRAIDSWVSDGTLTITSRPDEHRHEKQFVEVAHG